MTCLFAFLLTYVLISFGDVLSGISSGISFNISSDISSDILSGVSSDLLF